MTARPRKRLARALVALAFIAAGSSALAAEGRHLTLVKSEPAGSAKLVKAPSAVTLWFNQRPNIKLTKVFLTSATKDTLKTGAAESVDSTGKKIRVSIDSTISQGRYEVLWRTVARDGHAVSGKFAFSVDTATRPSSATALPR